MLFKLNEIRKLESQSENPANQLLEEMSDSARDFKSKLLKPPFSFNQVIKRCNASNLGVLNFPLTNFEKAYKEDKLYIDKT